MFFYKPGVTASAAFLGSKGVNPTSSVRRRARAVNHDIINDARMQLPQEFRADQNIAAAAILLQTLPEPQDPAQRDLSQNCQMGFRTL